MTQVPAPPPELVSWPPSPDLDYEFWAVTQALLEPGLAATQAQACDWR